MFERLADYALYKKGYIKALLDFKDWLTIHIETLKLYRMNNAKGIGKVMDAILAGNVDDFMKYGGRIELSVKADKK